MRNGLAADRATIPRPKPARMAQVRGGDRAAECGERAHALTVAEIEVGLRSRNYDAFDGAVRAAGTLGAAGDALLAAVEGLDRYRAVSVAAALGDVEGPHGGAVLRRMLAARGTGTADLRCAALLAVAKREGAHASAVLAEALDDAVSAVRDYAILGLAAVGDGRACDTAFARMKAMLARRRTREHRPSAVTLTVTYLLRHTDGDGGRAAAAMPLLRQRWWRLFDSERAWFAEHWPTLTPDGPDAPELADPAPMQRRLLESGLFTRPGPP